MANVKAWGLAINAPAQVEPIKRHCYGDCGKVSTSGGVSESLFGPLVLCTVVECPHVEIELPEPLGVYVWRGSDARVSYDVHLRGLKSDPASPQAEGGAAEGRAAG